MRAAGPPDGRQPSVVRVARVNEWLARVAAAVGCEEQLSEEDADALLKIARIAAHDGDDRRNAPLLTYLIGRSRGDRPLAEILETVRAEARSSS